MTPIDRALLAEKTAAVERHLRRVADRLPDRPDGLRPGTDAADAVILHLWQALQIVIDVAVSTCVSLHFGTPQTYADAFSRLEEEGVIEPELADRLARAARFRNLVVHAYGKLDMARVHRSAAHGPHDLRAFLAAIRDQLEAQTDV